jgi:alpha-glucosidase (family GH31 glycosyl hydrolase)
MLGENILVAPVFEEGAVSRDVYLPGPAEWKHLWTGEVYLVN